MKTTIPSTRHTAPDVQRNRANGSPARIKRLLVPMDFSESSNRALEYAGGFAQQFGADITLVHVLDPIHYPPGWDSLPLVGPKGQRPEVEKELRQRLQGLAQEALGPLLPATAIIRTGTPWNEITILAKQDKTDLIVIGTQGRTGLKHALMGSTAERVVRHAPCAVLVAR